MNSQFYKSKINFNTKARCDVTPLFEDPKNFSILISDMVRPFKKTKIDKIVGLDALGFVVGTALAIKLKKGFITIRKEGKLPGKPKTKLKMSFKDYTHKEKTFEINKSSIEKGEKILIVDEWVETGSQAKTAIKLVEKLGGKVVGIAAVNADFNKKTKILFTKYNLKPIMVNLQ